MRTEDAAGGEQMARSLTATLLLTVASLAIPAAASAQPVNRDADPGLETVTVTGSRVERSGFVAPTPTTVISSVFLEAKADTNVADMMTHIPSLAPNKATNLSVLPGFSAFDLRSIGATRTLVLIDGVRVLDTTPGHGFNASVLPANLISRLEIVTGGASAAYGSDAITGVVNVSLLPELSGGKLDLQYGQSNYSDNRQVTASFAYGHGFAGDRGQFLFAGSFFTQPKVLYEKSRPWGRESWGLMNNTPANIAAGGPRLILANNATQANMTYGGVITSGPPGLMYTQFGFGGQQSPFNRGGICPPGDNVNCQSGDGIQTKLTPTGIIAPSIERYNAYARLSYDLSSSTQVYASFLFALNDEFTTNVPNFDSGSLVVRNTNAFLPANILAQMNAAGLTQITMGRATLEGGITANDGATTYLQYVGGIKGSLPWGNWGWDAHLGYITTNYTITSAMNRINANWLNAVDSIVNPAVGGVAGVAAGAPICRSTLTNPTNGCVPANLFGINAVSPAAIAYTQGTSWNSTGSNQIDVAINLHGDIAEIWAGPISFAVGGEFRRLSSKSYSDPISFTNGWRQATQAPWSGSNSVIEGYVEAVVPLISNVQFLQNVEFNASARVAEYDSSGTAFVWKGGLNWSVNDQLRFRGTYSRDFRAPTLFELYSTTTSVFGFNVIDRLPGPLFGTSTQVTTITGGNLALKPETATTFTYGAVVSPSFIPNFTASVDYYNIRMGNAITSFNTQSVVDNCAAGQAVFCSGITRSSSTGAITRVQATAFNAQTLKVSGVDIEANYTLDLKDLFDLDASLNFSEMASYVSHLVTTANNVAVENAGFLVGNTMGRAGNALPHWRSTTTISYTEGPLSAQVQMYYTGPGRYSPSFATPQQISRNHWPGWTYFDLTAQYELSDRMQLYGKINNALNQDPPIMGTNGGVKNATTPSFLYDQIGRMFGIGLRYKW